MRARDRSCSKEGSPRSERPSAWESPLLECRLPIACSRFWFGVKLVSFEFVSFFLLYLVPVALLAIDFLNFVLMTCYFSFYFIGDEVCSSVCFIFLPRWLFNLCNGVFYCRLIVLVIVLIC